MSDDDINNLESRFPATSGTAFEVARRQALAAGQSVMESAAGALYEVFPNGNRTWVKALEPPTPVTPGLKVAIR